MALLTGLQVRNAKARDRAYKLFDERGLFLLVTPTGSRLWRLKYRIGNREKLLSLGIYPDVPLKRAREKRDEARRLVADEIDPSVERKARREAMLVTFEGVAQIGLRPSLPGPTNLGSLWGYGRRERALDGVCCRAEA